MKTEYFVLIYFALYVVSVISAYNWGWHSGHDIHHNDNNNGPFEGPPPSGPTHLWR